MLWRDVTPFPHQRVVLENDAIRHSGGRCADQKQQSEAGVRASANFRKTEPMYREQINTRPCSPTVVAPLHETRRASSKSGSDRWPGARPTRGHLRCRPAEGRRKHSPGFAAIRRSQNRSALTPIHSRGKVNNIRVTRIRRDAFDTEITRFSNRILQGFPTASCGIPSVGTAHVSSEIRETALSTAEHDAGRANPPPPTLTLRQT